MATSNPTGRRQSVKANNVVPRSERADAVYEIAKKS